MLNASSGASWPRRIDVPDQPMRIAQAVGPDLLARALEGRERIVVGDPIPPVLADRARRRVLAQVRDDAQDLADERVEPLRVQPAAVALLAGAGVAGAEVHDPPVGIAAPRDRIERHLAERMDGRRLLQAQQLSRRALERRVRRIPVLPFDQHDFAIDPSIRPSASGSPASSCSPTGRGRRRRRPAAPRRPAVAGSSMWIV